MRVIVNGKAQEVADGSTVSDLIEGAGLKPERLAVELNRVIIRRPDWGLTRLEEGDSVEIVHFVGGGTRGAG